MKKAIGLFLVFLFILLASAPKTHAMGPINFYIRGGILTESDFSFSSVLGLAGANIDLNLGPVLMISPECDILLYNFSFNPVFITPGVLVNIRASSFFFGAGVNLPIIIGSGYSLEGDFLLKINAGFKTDFIKFQAFVLTPLENAFDFTIIGATFGFGF
ncbi:MAG: hypothetical protein ACOC5F_00900 [Candidatus Aminicenantaceae bacterium]